MNTPHVRALLVLFVLGILGFWTASSQAQMFGQPFGQIYLSFDPTEQVQGKNVQPFVPFTFYLVVAVDFADIGLPEQNPINGIRAWECGVELPPQVIVLQSTLQPPSSINVGQPPGNWIVGTGTLVAAVNTPYPVVTFDALLTAAPPDLMVTLGPATPSSFDVPGGPGPVPGWNEWISVGECPDQCLRAFDDSWVDNWIVLNPTPVPQPYLELTGAFVAGDTGTPVELPIAGRAPLILKSGDPSDLFELDLALSWDASLADLVDVTLTPATTGFDLAFTAQPGSVVVSMTTDSGIDMDPDPVDLLVLHFQLGATEGATYVSFDVAQAFDGSLESIPVDTASGYLEVGCEKGDILDDDDVNSADAILSLKFATGQITPTPAQLCAADMNYDGDLNSADTILILRKAVGLQKAAPAATGAASIALVAGARPDEARVELVSVAGLDLVLDLDEGLTFLGTDVTNAGGSRSGLVAARVDEAGRVRIAYAAVEEEDVSLRLRFAFERAASGRVRIHEVKSHDARGCVQTLETRAAEIELRSLDPSVILGSRLLDASPNPFNPHTQIRFQLARAGDARLLILDAVGRRVRTFSLVKLPAGPGSVTWDGKDENGRRVASGVYTVRLEAWGARSSRRITLLK